MYEIFFIDTRIFHQIIGSEKYTQQHRARAIITHQIVNKD